MLNFYQVSVTALPGLSPNFVGNPENRFSHIASQMLFFHLFQSDDKQDDTDCDNFIGTWNSWWGCVLEIFLMKQNSLLT